MEKYMVYEWHGGQGARKEKGVFTDEKKSIDLGSGRNACF